MNPLSPNIFWFKIETRRSVHSLSPFGFDDVVTRVHHSPVKAPRKLELAMGKSKTCGACHLKEIVLTREPEATYAQKRTGACLYSEDGGNVSSNGRLHGCLEVSRAFGDC